MDTNRRDDARLTWTTSAFRRPPNSGPIDGAMGTDSIAGFKGGAWRTMGRDV
jgi:hypothetical protein